jgi:tetratricopeptide (TPR) repeat protein
VRRSAAAALLVLALLAPGCATVRWSAEPGLRQAALKEQAALQGRARAWEDPALPAYLAGLVERLTGARVTVHVLRDPTLGLFAMPTGEMFVHTGLLAVASREAEIAALLAHEFAHLVHRDALEAGEPDAVAPRLGGADLASRTAAAIFGLRLPLAARAAMSGHGLRREHEADVAAVAMLGRGGWDIAALPAMYERLAVQSREGGAREVFFFGDRRALTRRLDATRGLLAASITVVGASSGGALAGDDFERVWGPLVRENAAEEMRQGRFVLALRQLERAALATPADPRVHLHRGELHRLLAQRAASPAERDAQRAEARAAYDRALELDGTLAEVYRARGLLAYAAGDLAEARAELQHYLALAPAAPDRARLAEYVEELAR